MTSTRPYLLRALYDWISDNACTPYIIVDAGLTGVSIPSNYVVDGKIVLNISSAAVKGFVIGNEQISFSARFSGAARDVSIPVNAVRAIYAKENGEGLVFGDDDSPAAETDKSSSARERPHLRVVE